MFRNTTMGEFCVHENNRGSSSFDGSQSVTLHRFDSWCGSDTTGINEPTNTKVYGSMGVVVDDRSS